MDVGSPTPGDEGNSEERISRAREAIDRSFAELASRGGSMPSGAAPPPPSPPPPAGPPPGGSGGGGGDHEFERRVAAATEAIDRRVHETVSARLGAAERRLELQSKALEAALGEEAVQARIAVEQIE